MYATGVTTSAEHARILARIQPCDFLQLDMAAVGDHAARLLFISRQLGHTAVHLTVADYLAPHPSPSPEAQFVRDLFTMNPEQMAERWCGSTENAIALTRAIQSNIRA